MWSATKTETESRSHRVYFRKTVSDAEAQGGRRQHPTRQQMPEREPRAVGAEEGGTEEKGGCSGSPRGQGTRGPFNNGISHRSLCHRDLPSETQGPGAFSLPQPFPLQRPSHGWAGVPCAEETTALSFATRLSALHPKPGGTSKDKQRGVAPRRRDATCILSFCF